MKRLRGSTSGRPSHTDSAKRDMADDGKERLPITAPTRSEGPSWPASRRASRPVWRTQWKSGSSPSMASGFGNGPAAATTSSQPRT